MLADFCPFGVDHRVVGGGRLGQTREHRRLGRGDFGQRLAEIDLRGRGKPVGALAEVDLVEVDLEDLLFRECLLDLQCDQDLVDLAGVAAFVREKEIARELHGDRAGPLGLAARRQIGKRRAGNTQKVDAAVGKETVVLGGQDGPGHDWRHILEFDDAAALFTELADQHAIGGIDAQRHFWPVVGQCLHRRQPFARQDGRQAERQRKGQRQHQWNPDQDRNDGQRAEATLTERSAGRHSP